MSANSAPERSGIVTFKGEPVTLVGPQLAAGSEAPDFTVVAGDLSPVSLREATADGTKAAMFVVVPSLDTDVCSLESQKFNARLGELPAGVATFVVSLDLPFA